MPSFMRNLLPSPHLPHFQPILPLTRALWTLRRLCGVRQVSALYSGLPLTGPFGHCHIGRDKLVLSFFCSFGCATIVHGHRGGIP